MRARGSAILVQRHADFGRMTIHRFVDDVIDDFPDEVMQTRDAHATDVHAGAFTNGFEPL